MTEGRAMTPLISFLWDKRQIISARPSCVQGHMAVNMKQDRYLNRNWIILFSGWVNSSNPPHPQEDKGVHMQSCAWWSSARVRDSWGDSTFGNSVHLDNWKLDWQMVFAVTVGRSNFLCPKNELLVLRSGPHVTSNIVLFITFYPISFLLMLSSLSQNVTKSVHRNTSFSWLVCEHRLMTGSFINNKTGSQKNKRVVRKRNAICSLQVLLNLFLQRHRMQPWSSSAFSSKVYLTQRRSVGSSSKLLAEANLACNGLKLLFRLHGWLMRWTCQAIHEIGRGEDVKATSAVCFVFALSAKAFPDEETFSCKSLKYEGSRSCPNMTTTCCRQRDFN